MNENSSLYPKYSSFYTGFLLITLCGLHIGFSEFISFQFLFSFLLFIFVVSNGYFFSTKAIFFSIFPFLLGLIVIIINLESLNTLLWFCRICLVVHVLLTFYYTLLEINLRDLELIKNIFEKALIYFTYILAFVVFIQAAQITISSFTSFIIPTELFSLPYGTLDSRSFRPSGLFSEPSTLGLVGAVIAAYGLMNNKNLFVITGVALSLLSLALSAFIMLLFLFVGFSFLAKREFYFALIGVSFFSLLLLLSFAQDYLIQRLGFIMQGEDNSVYVRLIFPLQFIIDQFQSGNYFGTSNTELSVQSIISGAASLPKDNYIFNVVILAGIVSLPILYFHFAGFPNFIIFLFIGLSFVNGDIFYYDRVVLLVFCIVFYVFFERKETAK
jgi:hypothetical protein